MHSNITPGSIMHRVQCGFLLLIILALYFMERCSLLSQCSGYNTARKLFYVLHGQLPPVWG